MHAYSTLRAPVIYTHKMLITLASGCRRKDQGGSAGRGRRVEDHLEGLVRRQPAQVRQ